VRVPLVLVTGFLGAGKTTLVNRLLARRAERGARGKIGVIVNELGEVGIDGALLAGDASRQVELPGGCVCCVLGDELDKTLIDLVESNPGPEYEIDASGGKAEGLAAIVLETTGVAEPLPIAWAVQRAPVAQRVRLAAVVTLVDAAHFRASRPVSVAVDAQVAYADVLLITKEPVAGREAEAAIDAAHALAPRALIRRGTTEEHAAWLEQVLADPSLERPADAPGGHHHDDECGHTHGVDSTWVEIPGVVDLEELEDALAELPASYVRIKGIAFASDGRAGDPAPRWVAVHRVGLRVSSEPLPRIPDGFGGERGRLVALGRELDPADLSACVDVAVRAR